MQADRPTVHSPRLSIGVLLQTLRLQIKQPQLALDPMPVVANDVPDDNRIFLLLNLPASRVLGHKAPMRVALCASRMFDAHAPPFDVVLNSCDRNFAPPRLPPSGADASILRCDQSTMKRTCEGRRISGPAGRRTLHGRYTVVTRRYLSPTPCLDADEMDRRSAAATTAAGGHPNQTGLCTGPTEYGRIISLSSCDRIWQCHTY
jgi:hypothetical protein